MVGLGERGDCSILLRNFPASPTVEFEEALDFVGVVLVLTVGVHVVLERDELGFSMRVVDHDKMEPVFPLGFVGGVCRKRIFGTTAAGASG